MSVTWQRGQWRREKWEREPVSIFLTTLCRPITPHPPRVFFFLNDFSLSPQSRSLEQAMRKLDLWSDLFVHCNNFPSQSIQNVLVTKWNYT